MNVRSDKIAIAAGKPPPTPIPNSYWVEPGRILAGEYPGSPSRVDAEQRLEKFLEAGVSSFIDLTQAGELPPYQPWLSAKGIAYRRLPITDHGLPDSPQTMVNIVTAMTAEVAAGRCVYVHCRAGIGRTGMAVACYLMREGLDGEAALAKLQILWQQCARSRSWPRVPETDAQVQYVRRWAQSAVSARPSGVASVISADLGDRLEGALIGLALGDAFGQRVPPSADAAAVSEVLRSATQLSTGADTAMTLVVAESLLARRGHNAEDHLRGYQMWVQTGAAPVPAELKRALHAWQRSRRLNAGSHDPKNLDPHSLARTLAVAMYARRNPAAAIELAAEVSRPTQQSPVVLDACRAWTAILVDALLGEVRPGVAQPLQGRAVAALRDTKLRAGVGAVLHGKVAAPARDSGVLVSMSVALQALRTTGDFASGMVQALGNAPNATVGALYGSLGGACYGARGVAAEWRSLVPREQQLRTLARRFL